MEASPPGRKWRPAPEVKGMRVSFWHRLLLLAPAGVLLAGAGAPAAPEPILTGYTGAFLGNDGYQRFLPLLRDHGFNAADFKFHPAEFDPKDPAVEAYLADLVRRCQAHGLRVFLYLYPEEKGTRNPQAAASGPYVGDDGVTHQRMYCLFQADAWQAMFRRVFFLARLSRTQAIEGVKIDIELNENSSPCFCDDCWHSFAGAGEKRDLPAAGRAPWLRESGKSDAYLAHLEARLDRAVAAYAARAHAENPRLKLGMMPARDDMLTRAFARGLGTAEAPAILDCWIPYDGLGWREEVGAFRTQMRALNPNSLVIPWFRVNRYRPEDLPAHAYAMATEADGYDMWTISMIHPEQPLKDRAAYALPPQHPDPMAYWRAFGEANRGVRAWVAAGGKTPSPFTLKPIRPLAPDVDLAGLVVPRQAPLGPRDPSAKTPAPTTYRDRTVFLVYAAERERPITARIRHQAGRQRNEPLAWALADAAGKPVSDGLVQPGETATLSQGVPEAGI